LSGQIADRTQKLACLQICILAKPGWYLADSPIVNQVKPVDTLFKKIFKGRFKKQSNKKQQQNKLQVEQLKIYTAPFLDDDKNRPWIKICLFLIGMTEFEFAQLYTNCF